MSQCVGEKKGVHLYLKNPVKILVKPCVQNVILRWVSAVGEKGAVDKNLATEHVGAIRAGWATRDSRQAGQSYILDRVA